MYIKQGANVSDSQGLLGSALAVADSAHAHRGVLGSEDIRWQEMILDLYVAHTHTHTHTLCIIIYLRQ